jgi:hypothetical protein
VTVSQQPAQVRDHRLQGRVAFTSLVAPDGQITSSPLAVRFQLVQPPLQKYFCFSETEIELYDLPSRPERGALAIVTNVGAGSGGRGSARAHEESQGGFPVSDRSARRRTVLVRTTKSCGPDASAVGVKSAEVLRAQPGEQNHIRRRRCQTSPITGEITKISVKTTAQGKSDCLRWTCMLVCVFLHNFAHETAGAARIRLSLRPLLLRG